MKPYPSFPMVPFPMTLSILSDLGSLSKILNDAKHGAASLRQLSFFVGISDVAVCSVVCAFLVERAYRQRSAFSILTMISVQLTN